MQVELTAKQLQVLMTLTDEWLRAASPESRQAEAEAPPIDLEIDLTGLQELRDCLRDQAQRAAEAEAWHGYVEARRVPCNPSPGSGSS